MNTKNRKKVYIRIVAVIIIAIMGIFLCACTDNKADESLLRLHIRAESNNAADQAVKLLVRDSIVTYLEDELKSITDLETAKREINKRAKKIKELADSILAENGFDYRATVSVRNEYFPTRMYDELVVESGYYDALIIELGSGNGDNWWCVIYPPLCYVEVQFGSGFRYKSKIKELIDKYFGD